MSLLNSGGKEDSSVAAMEEKSKRKPRSKVANGESKGKSRAPKVEPILVPPETSELKLKSAEERLDATVPLAQPRNGNTNPFENGGTTAYAAQPPMALPRKVSCQQVEASYLSDVGQHRDNNEDSAGVFLGTIPRPDGNPELFFGFLVVADGMGGHESGEVASNLAVRKLTEGVLKYFYLPTIEGRQPGNGNESPAEILQGLVEDVNQAILQEAYQNRISMGTTLTGAVLVGQTAFISHVGDSRLYVLEKSSGSLRQVTHDHSMVQRLVDLGQLSPEDALNSPQRSILYLSLGQKGRIEADVEVISLNDVNYMLLCSDGLWDMIEDHQIEQILRTASGPADASVALVEAANRAGGADNVTVVVAKF
jgi:serine/threonine protein phosphatase PrpC